MGAEILLKVFRCGDTSDKDNQGDIESNYSFRQSERVEQSSPLRFSSHSRVSEAGYTEKGPKYPPGSRIIDITG